MLTENDVAKDWFQLRALLRKIVSPCLKFSFLFCQEQTEKPVLKMEPCVCNTINKPSPKHGHRNNSWKQKILTCFLSIFQLWLNICRELPLQLIGKQNELSRIVSLWFYMFGTYCILSSLYICNSKLAFSYVRQPKKVALASDAYLSPCQLPREAYVASWKRCPATANKVKKIGISAVNVQHNPLLDIC